jgi:hypothetical protein
LRNISTPVHRGLLRVADADDLDFLAHRHHAALDAPRHHRAAARDREHVLDRHQERLVDRAVRRRDVLVHRLHQLGDLLRADLLVAVLERGQRRARHDRDVVAGEVVGGQQLAHLHLDQLQQLLVVDLVDLVQEHHQRRHADLARQQDVLARLRHRAVGGVHHQDRAVHLRRAGDHVLDVVGVARAVDMRVVARFGLVFDMRRRDRDPARLLLRRRVDLVIRLELAELLRDRRRQRRLAVVDVTDRPDVHMRLVPLELRLRHLGLLLS